MNTPEEKSPRDLSVSTGRVQVLALPFILASLLLMLPYGLLWGAEAFSTAWLGFFDSLWFLPAIFVGILVHELIHAFTWQQLAGLRWSEMKLGFQWKTLTPYAHARQPMKMNPYRWGAFMPALLLGFIPYFISLLIGSGWLFAFGILFITAAAGDFWILYVLRNESAESWVTDHPERAGCIVYEK
jgi:hypothetical protein